jgi:hypothetical protein
MPNVSGSPQFAPLPPLPPLPRAPTGASLAGVGAPPATVGHAAPAASASLRFPQSTGAVSQVLSAPMPNAPPGPVPSPFGATPAPITAVHNAPHFASPPVTAPYAPATTSPPPAGAGPMSMPGSMPGMTPRRTATPDAAVPSGRPAPIASFQPPRPAHVLGEPRASTSAAAASATALGHPSTLGIADELTQDVPRGAQVLPPALHRAARGPAAFPAVFFVGFLVAFLPAALILWRTPDAAELFAAGQYDAVVALVEALATTETPATADELVLAGHAFAALGQRDRMVKTYAAARLLKKDIKDDRIVDNLMKALPDERAGAGAAALLAEDWKGKNVLALLQLELQNEDRIVRHHALRAVEPRLTDPNERARVRLAVARVDLKDTSDCEVVKEAMLTIEDLVAKFPVVVRGIDLDSEVDAAGQRQASKGKAAMCFSLKDVERITRALAVAEKPN